MSNILNDLIRFGTQTVTEPQTTHSAKSGPPIWLDKEFRSALDHYMGIFARASTLIS
jgi:hypothetical protein